jgi:hypothetical protein
MKLGDVTDVVDPMRRALDLQQRSVDRELADVRDLLGRIVQDHPDYQFRVARRVDLAVFTLERGGVAMCFSQKFAAIFSDVAPVLHLRVVIADAIAEFERQCGLRKPAEKIADPVSVTVSGDPQPAYRHEVMGPDGWVDMARSAGVVSLWADYIK